MAFRIFQERQRDIESEYLLYRNVIHIKKEGDNYTFLNVFENEYYFQPLAIEIISSYVSSFYALLLMAKNKDINADNFFFYILKGREFIFNSDLSINFPLEEGEYIEDDWTEYKMFPGHYAWYKIGKRQLLFYNKTLYFFQKENGEWADINQFQSTTSSTFEAAIAIVKRCENDTQQITWELFLKLCGACKEWLNRHPMSHTNQCGTRIKTVAAVKKFVEKWQQTH